MEDIQKLLKSTGVSTYALDSSDSGDSDSDVSCESMQFKLQPDNATEMQPRKRNGEARLPTRRPDPNIYNRNALLARENRRKKKEYLETIEKELEETRNTNRALVKALKKQLKTARRLKEEKQYFKSLVANRNEILDLVSALNTRLSAHPLSPLISAVSPKGSSSYYDGGDSVGGASRSSSSYDLEPLAIHFDQQQRHLPTSTTNGSVEAATAQNVVSTFFSLSPASDPNKFLDNFFTDFAPTSAFDDTWKELMQEDEFVDLKDKSLDQLPLTTDHHIHNICDEHSYVSTLQRSADDKNISGVCLHIARGKVSSEFCPSCHCNASASRTPPTQLLQED